MYVKPTAGLSIRDPDLKDLLPDEGREVPESDYWHRRVRDKDVDLGTAPVAQPGPEAAAAETAPAAASKKANKGSQD